MGLSGKKQQDARDEIELVGVELGLAFEDSDSSGIDPIDFYLLPKGRPRGASNVLNGRIGATPVRAFEWTAQRPLDSFPEIAGFPSSGGGRIRLSGVLVELPSDVHTVLLTRGPKAGNRGLPHVRTGNAWLDEWFVCHTRHPEVAAACDDAAFVQALAGCPDGTSIELTARSLLAIHAPVDAEGLGSFVRVVVALSEVVPAAARRTAD